jgi:hypothetical protein
VGKGQYRDVLWILWRYDWRLEQWAEIARAQSRDATWTYALREPALAALHPEPRLFDVEERAAEVAGAVMDQIDKVMVEEVQPVRQWALNAVYDRVAGRIASIL